MNKLLIYIQYSNKEYFIGNTINGFIVHPDGKHVVYPLGNKITIQEWSTKRQRFLVGHTNNISSVCVSETGKYIASGQINHIGFKVSNFVVVIVLYVIV